MHGEFELMLVRLIRAWNTSITRSQGAIRVSKAEQALDVCNQIRKYFNLVIHTVIIFEPLKATIIEFTIMHTLELDRLKSDNRVGAIRYVTWLQTV